MLLLAIGGSWSTTSAQPAPWHIDQGSDGTLYLLTGDTRYVLNPDAIADDNVAALIDGGVLGSQLPLLPPLLLVAPAAPLTVLSEPIAPVSVNAAPAVAQPPAPPSAPATPAGLVMNTTRSQSYWPVGWLLVAGYAGPRPKDFCQERRR